MSKIKQLLADMVLRLDYEQWMQNIDATYNESQYYEQDQTHQHGNGSTGNTGKDAQRNVANNGNRP